MGTKGGVMGWDGGGGILLNSISFNVSMDK